MISFINDIKSTVSPINY